MKPREYAVLEHAIECGIASGVRRAFKHSETQLPDRMLSELEYHLYEALTNSICEWFEIDNEQQSET